MLENMWAPRGVAVVGVSQNPEKLGYGVARNLVVSGYSGAIHFVNPHGGQLFDRPVHQDLAHVPDPVDLAMIMIPASGVPQALEECGRRGIRAVVIGSGGFRETGEEGRKLEEQALRIARKHHIRVIGPNCIGFLDTHLPIDVTFLPLPGPVQGDIAFLSHSGAICEAVIDWARGQGFGLSRLVSLGNQMDLTEADCLPMTVADPETRVVAMYLEGVHNGRLFVENARKATRKKPVLAIKVGRSESGRRAVASHTGALAGSDVAYDAAFRKAGVVRVQSTEELFDWARALAWCPLPRGRRIAVLTNAGGPGAITADALETCGLKLAALSQATTARLRELLPPAASVRNPVDMLAGGGVAEYTNCLSALMADDGVDGVILILAPPPMTTASSVAGAIIPMVRSATKPVIMTLMGEDLIAAAARLLRQARVPDYRFPERAASAMGVLADRSEALATPMEQVPALKRIHPEAARRAIERGTRGEDGFLDAASAAQVARAYGVPVPEEILAHSAAQAVAAARKLGFPVALKIASPDIPHKSDVGGVALDVKDESGVSQEFERMLAQARSARPQATIPGVTVQPMLPHGQEVIVGVVRDEQFGPLVMFGSGGVEVEGLKDVAFALAPLTPREAEALLDDTWAGRRMRGFRNIPAGDRDAALDAVVRLARLAEDLPEIDEIEVNPLRVLPGKGGAVAVDVRLKLREVRGT
jgi:acetyl coenzyme A synthetase (ADP forming)-like protein